jgi:dolichyl-diphosphooligosaccharide--protein glycosyltransferase/undecaprenyl-diphosphooligosaccharide--protein glycosyltransferase
LIFGNLDLTTGKKEREIMFFPTLARKKQNSVLTFSNGIVFDMRKGILFIGDQKIAVKDFIITSSEKDGEIKLKSQVYHPNGGLIVIYMQSYGKFIVMDMNTFKSMYVQMFILGKYDKNLFELVVASPYSRIYRLKK